jgi:hypothetical protein
MALATKGLLVAVINGSLNIFADNFEDGKPLFLVTKTSDGGIAPRGKEIVSGGGAVMQNGFVAADFVDYPASGEATGFTIPAAVTAMKPASWEAKEDADGRTYFKKRVPTDTDTNGDGVVDTKDTQRSANFLTTTIDWFGKNPIAIVGGVILLYLLLKPKGKGKSKGLLSGIL